MRIASFQRFFTNNNIYMKDETLLKLIGLVADRFTDNQTIVIFGVAIVLEIFFFA